jgi:putative endonuclease
MHYIYILQSEKDNSFYIGETDNLKERLKFHNKGLQRYTRNKIPWKLVYFEKYPNRREALKREKEIKRKKSKRYIEWLIKNKH